MILSGRAINTLRRKYKNGLFNGFDLSWNENNFSEEDARQDFNDLTDNELIFFKNDEVHISPLGQHILNMMYEPEILVKIDNFLTDSCLRLYIKNAYYLCVINTENAKLCDENTKYIIELVPDIKLVVGSFAFALERNNRPDKIPDVNRDDKDVIINGYVWDKSKTKISSIRISGKYIEEKILCSISDDEKTHDVELSSELQKHELINRITDWMLSGISMIMESEAIIYDEI